MVQGPTIVKHKEHSEMYSPHLKSTCSYFPVQNKINFMIPTTPLRSRNCSPHTCSSLPRVQPGLFPMNNLGSLLYDLRTLCQNQLNVARVRHVWVDLNSCQYFSSIEGLLSTYTTMCTICPASLFRSLVDLNVLNDQIARIQSLGICVRLRILQKRKEMFGRLDWPSGSRNTKLLSCSVMSSATELQPTIVTMSLLRSCICSYPALTLGRATNASSIPPERHNLLVLNDVVQVSDSTL